MEGEAIPIGGGVAVERSALQMPLITNK